jgi:hypothetical protein
MSTRQYDSATDLITFSRASGGTALRKVAYGSELVTNGTFDTDTTGWSAERSGLLSSVGGSLVVENGAANYGYASQSFATEIGKCYVIEAAVVSSSNGAIVRAGISSTTGDYLNKTTSGADEHKVSFVATTTTTYIYLGTQLNTLGHTAIFDNVSVKEVTFDQGDLTLFNHPADIPRIEYDANGNVLGLLVEEQRTNLVTYSEDFSESFWSTFGVSISSNVAVSPDGSTSADKLVENDQSSNHQVNWGLASIELATDAPLSFSIFAKAGERNKMAFRWGVWVFCTFDLSAGSVTPLNNATYVVTNAATVDCGNGWYRCQFTIKNTGATALAQASWRILDAGGNQSYLGDGTSGLYIWGAQLEAGSFSTSYIPTSGSTATRSADVASIPVSAFGYNQSEGTVVVGYDAKYDSNPVRIVEFENTITDRITLYQGNDGAPAYVFVRKDSVTQATVQTANSAQVGVDKIAVSATAEDTRICLNGGTVAEDTSTDMPPVVNISLGQSTAGGKLNGHIKSIKYYPRRLTNSQLQELTS